MNPLDYIYQRLSEVIAYLNLMRENSKRIDELPASTEGSKLLAVWNITTQTTQKISRDELVAQDNKPMQRPLGLIPGNGILTPVEVRQILIDRSIGFNILETTSIYFIDAEKRNGTKIYKYFFYLQLPKGFWGWYPGYTPFVASLIRQISSNEITPTDIQPGPDVEIFDLGNIPSLESFVDVANSETYNFTDDTKTYYFTYSVTYSEGTPEEQQILYLSQFVGTPGIYGGEATDMFVDSDFINTANSQPSNSGLRIDYGQIVKIGKGYTEDIDGVYANAGSFEEDERGDIYAGIDEEGYLRIPMRYAGTGDINDFDNHVWDFRSKPVLDGEPGYIDLTT